MANLQRLLNKMLLADYIGIQSLVISIKLFYFLIFRKPDKVLDISTHSVVFKTEADSTDSVTMSSSNMQLEKTTSESTALVSGNREEEVETVEETTLSEVSKRSNY